MNLEVVIDRKARKMKFIGKTVQQLSVMLGVNHETTIIKKNGEIAHPGEMLSDKDRVEFIGIIYGG